MQATRTGSNEITITGNIKTTEDYLQIRQLVMELVSQGQSALVLNIRESLSMPSSVIGFFVKLVHRDKVKVAMHVQDNRLLELLQELSLVELFGARLS